MPIRNRKSHQAESRGRNPVARDSKHLTQTQFDRRSWALLGLAILVILAFAFTLPSLYISLVRSGFLGDLLPANGGWGILVGLTGLTLLFCLYMVHQQAQINRYRRRLIADQMELEQSRVRLGELTSLFQLGNSLHMDLPLEAVLEITVRRVASSLHSHDVAVFLYEPEAKTLVCRANFGLAPRAPEPEVKLGEGAVGWVARHREPILMQASEKEARFADFFTAHPDAGSVLILPVTVEKRCVAVLQVCRPPKAEPFRLEHRDLGQLFAANVGVVIDRAHMVATIHKKAAETEPGEPPDVATAGFQDAFLSAASNELKAPLTTIVAYSEVLEQNDPRLTPSMRHEFTARVRGEAQRLMGLVDDVLELVRLEMGRFLLDLHVDNVNRIARDVVEQLRPIATSKGVVLEVALDEKIPNQHLDPTKVRQALLHLLRNGIRFSPAKSHVGLSTWLGDDHVLIEIRDNGPTLDAEPTSRVFDLYTEVDSPTKRGKDGLGFGLHLVKRFVELHGGEVGVGPAPGGMGALFWIRLPRGEDLASLIGEDPFLEQMAKG
jgi:signal transduction histidine kinase